jgi:hypothetical protein
MTCSVEGGEELGGRGGSGATGHGGEEAAGGRRKS